MRTGIALVILGLAGIVSAGTAQQVSIGARWEVALFLNVAPEVLGRVACVRYTPPSPRTAQEVCRTQDPAYPFAYRGALAAGTRVAVLVRFSDGSSQQLTYVVSTPEQTMAIGTGAVTAGGSALSVDNVATRMGADQWAWTAFVKGTESTLSLVRCVEYTLHPTFPDPVRTVCVRGTGPQAFALKAVGWGTFELRIKVRFRDGKTEEFRHYLKFEAGAPSKE